MFDWNDEEFANIIWGEPGETGDHIVPYPEASEDYSDKKERNQEPAGNKPTEQKTSGTRRKLDDTYNLKTREGVSGSGFATESWADLSSSKATRTDRNSMGTEVSNRLSEISKFESSRAQAGQLEKDADMYSSTQESKEQGEFVDYGWDNIGSFDDLDRIFSNDDQLFGNISLGDSDELWSSSKDMSVTDSQEKSFPSFGSERNVPDHADVKTEYLQQNQLYKLGCDKVTQDLQRANEVVEKLEFTGDKSDHAATEQTDLKIGGKNPAATSHLAAENVLNSNKISDKAYKQRKLLKGRRKIEVGEARTVLDLCGNWSSSTRSPNQFETNLASPSIKSPPSSLTQHRQLQGPPSLQYQHMSNAFLQHTAYGTLGNPYPSMPVLSHIQPGELQHQSLLSGYDISPGRVSQTNKPVDCPVNSLIMTPQEKIEKLRRRQQMQAMLAIQKQQQQFGNQVPCSSHSTSQKCHEETQIQNFEKSDLDVEDISTLPAQDSKPHLEQNDSSTVSLAVDDYSVEDKILYRLQDIISKLDIKIRLCMRDSLYRLAQSAMQRHCGSDTSSTTKSSRDEHEVGPSGEINSHSWYAGMPDVETETNPIDRTVAHLLFHRPLELSGKQVDGPQSPIFPKLMQENKASGLVNSPQGCLAGNSKDKPFISSQGSKNSCPSAEPQNLDDSRSSPCADTSENASHNKPENLAAVEFEASQ